MKTYTCVRCGAEFQANRKTAVCENCHTAVCCVCGKGFRLISPYNQKTCSSKCRGIYRKESGISKQVYEKARNTIIDRYGVDNASHVTQTYQKICKYCGKPFETTSAKQLYCNDEHYGSCPICGKPSRILDMSQPVPTCSPECRQVKIESSCMMKYENPHAVNSNHARELSKKHCLEKYGVEHYSKTLEYRYKFKQASLEKYGVEHPNQSEKVREKTQKTNIERYGVPYLFASHDFHEKNMKKTIENYGGIGYGSPTLREKIVSTNVEKYGVPYPAQSEKVKQKMEQTSLVRYGYKHYQSSYEGYANKINNPEKIDEFLRFKSNPKEFIEEHFDHTPTCKEICELTGVTDTPIYDIMLKSGLRDMMTFRSSTMEVEIYQLLLTYLDETEIRKNYHSVIYPYEIDFYIEKLHFGIECNPTVTHNSSRIDPWGQSPKKYNYHKKKSVMCRDKDVFLFHIFGYEWENRKDVIKSMIVNVLGKSENKEYARKTSVHPVSFEEGRKFLEEHHRQGSTNFSIAFGLYKDNNLLSLMTFNKMRSSIGKSKEDTSNTYELSRFCNKKYSTVVGGASKLFKHFISTTNCDKVVSFSDIAHTRGLLYETLGFSKIVESAPSYVWVNPNTDSYLNRVSCRKSNLKRTLQDDSIDIEANTEKEIMEEHGYVRVYDSGTIRWEYT